MTQLEFFEMFSAEELELLCSRIEFLEAVTADPFDAENTGAVANRILDFDSRQITRRWEPGGVLEVN